MSAQISWHSTQHRTQWGEMVYYVTGSAGKANGATVVGHTCQMTQEMVDDDWLPDVVARIERVIRIQVAA